MPLLLKRRSRPRSKNTLTTEMVGHVLVVHAPAGMSDEARAVAAALPADPEHELVVADMPVDSPSTAWEALAATLPPDEHGVRLLVAGHYRHSGAQVAQWLSTRLERTVIASNGAVQSGANGVLFVPSAHGGGWVRFRPGEDPVSEGRRFPRPSWDAPLLAEVTPLGADVTAEPLPAGLWLHTGGDERWLAVNRARLIRLLPCQPEVVTLVLGGQHLPELPLEQVARFWEGVPSDVRSKVRFMQYGPVRPARRGFGSALADALGEEVTCYTGIPVGRPEFPDVFTVRPDGSHGWNTYAQTFVYRPGAAPLLHAHRTPLAHLLEVAPGVYRYAEDAVLEVVQSGLWIRPPREPAHAAEVRASAVDPVTSRLLYDTSDDEQAGRMRAVAEELAERLPYPARLATRLLPVGLSSAPPEPFEVYGADEAPEEELPWLARLIGSGSFVPPQAHTGGESRIRLPLTGADSPDRPPTLEKAKPEFDSETLQLHRVPLQEPEAVAEPAAGAAEPHEPIARPASSAPPPTASASESAATETAPSAESLLVQPLLAPEASLAGAGHGLDEDRAWLHEVWQARYDAEADSVEQVLAVNPELAGHLAGALPDAIAVRLYLAGRDGDIDTPLRAGRSGPHLRFGRCAAAGLARLSGYRGPTTTTLTVTPTQWEYLREQPVLAEWGFLNLLTAPCASLPGNVDLLVWSSSGRRTAALEPPTDGVADRVVFLPGTRFKVLGTVEPEPGGRGQVLLRELAPTEFGADGRVDRNRSSLDKFAKISLGRAPERWGRKEPTARVPAAMARRFHHLPGLVSG